MAIQIIGWDDVGNPIYGDPMQGGTQQGDASGASQYGGPGFMPLGSTYTAPQNQNSYAEMPRPVNPPSPTGNGSYGKPGYTGITIPSYTNPEQNYFDAAYGARDQVMAGYTGGVRPATQKAQGALDQGLQWQGASLETLKNSNEQAKRGIDTAIQDQYNNTNGANANGQRLVAEQGAAFAGLNAADWGALGQFNSDLNPSNFSGAYTPIGYDQEGLTAQRQALSNFGDIYGGSLDYQAAQAQAAHAQAYMAQAAHARAVEAAVKQYNSNPGDVRQQQDAINKIKGAINGGEWYDSMKDANAKYNALTTPEITDQERFIMERMRQNTEGQMRSNREALDADLGARGIRSGASEQVGLGMYNQQVGGDRVLAELGAGANAIGRSMDALEGYAGTAAMGRQAELQAMGMYSDASGQLREMNDRVGMFNTAEWNQTERLNATNKTNVNMQNAQNDTNVSIANANNKTNVSIQNARNDTDVSMFNAGQINQARANNQATRLAGAQGFSTAATNLRNSNETINMFNKDQEMVQTRHQDQVKLDAANSRLQGNLATTGQIGGRISEQTSTALGENDQGWARNTATNDRRIGAEGTKSALDAGFANMGFDYGKSIGNSGIAGQGIALSDQGALQGGVVSTTGLIGDANKLVAGQNATTAAQRIAERQAKEDNDPVGIALSFTNPLSFYEKWIK